MTLTLAAYAQDVVVADPANSWMEGLLNFIIGFGTSNPKAAPFLAILFLVGLAAKLIREAIEKFVLSTPSKRDDEKLAKAKQNKVVKVVLFILDLLFRLKTPEAK